MRVTILLLAAAMLVASCADTTPPPTVTPQGEDRYLIDPRTGYGAIAPEIDRRFEAAWRFAMTGNEMEARRRLAEIQNRDATFLPAMLAEALLDIQAGRLDSARAAIELALKRKPDYTAAQVYEAEIAVREQKTRLAYDLYREIAARPDAPPTANERIAQLQTTLYEQLFAAAQAAPDAEAIALLREALTFNPAAIEPRLLLARKLLLQRNFDESRRELDPILNTGEVDRPEVQELLAEIDVGRGRYQEAIARYDRLARRTREPRYAQRLEEVKEEWSMANMPPQYRAALDSIELTRADLAILLYWTVPSVRFATNLGAPPIAVDIEDVTGREEIIRAIAIGLYDVDPVTRRVSPYRVVTAERLARFLARLLTLRGAACARGLATDKALAACGVSDPLAAFAPDATVTGQDGAKLLAEIKGKL
ncbi:MAG TPA: tetratricopeptide repeat protein [Thermoanaerobaculia bacterium]|nr:tetratricopeptide repeat protein [Thermoanaerobaculia bacterium]